MTNSRFTWKPGSRLKGDVTAIAEVLERIRVRNDELKPSMVVKEARNPKSVLHSYFDWDDKIAADKWRIEQAKYIIRCVAVVNEGEDGEEGPMVRAFVSVVDEDGDASYTSIAHAMADDDLRIQVLKKAHKELKDWADRYRDLKEFAAVFEAMETVEV